MSGSLRLFDTHCHLHAEEFDRDRDLVIARARLRQVRRVLAVAEDLDDAYRLLAIAPRHGGFLGVALGVHPDRAPRISDGEVAAVVSLIRRHASTLVAIGEVGLDFRPCWDARDRDRQKEVLRTMIALAQELDLPLSLHSRSAGHHLLEVLLAAGPVRACLHAFDGRASYGLTGAEAGFFFSVPPSVVRSRVLQKLVLRLPREALLLESDSPVLGPNPRERNEPSNLHGALRAIASLRGECPDGLAETIASNTLRALPRLQG